MRVCPDCQAQVADTANFCDNCGYPLGAASPPPDPPAPPDPPPLALVEDKRVGTGVLTGACSACGYVNLPGEMFCQNCGVQLPPVASLPPPPPQAVSSPLDNRPPEAPRSALPAPSPALPSAPPPVAPPVAPGTASATIHGRLLLRTTRQSIPLPQGESQAILGRSDPVKGVYPHVDLSPFGGGTSGVSRRHARLVAQGGQLYVEDLNSTNFTFLNQQKLTPGQLYPINNGDELRLGLMVLEFVT